MNGARLQRGSSHPQTGAARAGHARNRARPVWGRARRCSGRQAGPPRGRGTMATGAGQAGQREKRGSPRGTATGRGARRCKGRQGGQGTQAAQGGVSFSKSGVLRRETRQCGRRRKERRNAADAPERADLLQPATRLFLFAKPVRRFCEIDTETFAAWMPWPPCRPNDACWVGRILLRQKRRCASSTLGAPCACHRCSISAAADCPPTSTGPEPGRYCRPGRARRRTTQGGVRPRGACDLRPRPPGIARVGSDPGAPLLAYRSARSMRRSGARSIDAGSRWP